jgi:fructosamine-3-kinase
MPSLVSVDQVHGVGGGCISQASRATVWDDAGCCRVVFVKSNAASFLDNFQAEREGLIRLGQPGTIRVPRPLALGVAEQRAWLVTEWIEPGQRPRDFYARLGRNLAELHRATLGDRIGLEQDNFLGASPQCNAPTGSWVEFVAVQRIGIQLRWASERGLADAALRRDVSRIVASMDRLLVGRDPATSLLHGDLWSGNYLCDSSGEPVLVDPAVYHGCREAEFGMLRLFGACPPEFDDAYQETFPLPAGWQSRVNVYVLYHLLNHLNLFGRGYHDQCLRLAAEILRC